MHRLRTFGAIAIERDGVPLTGRATQRRRLALMVLLASAGARGMRRDKLLVYLWPESDAEQGRHSLSQTLYSLRQELGADAILAGVDDVRLNDAVVASDLREFEDALAAGALDRATAQYHGPFLDGFFLSGAPEFERWVETERERLASACRAAYASLARAAASAGDWAGAARHWRRHAELEPLNSNVALELMQALAASGDHAGALRHERAHAALLRAELDAEPPAALREFAERLRADAVTAASVSAVSTKRPDQSRMSGTAGGTRRATAALDYPIRLLRRSAELGVEHPRTTRIGGLVVAGIVTLGVILFARANAHFLFAARHTAAQTVLVGDVLGRDTVLAGAVREALRAELESADGTRVVGDAAVRQTLRLMKVPLGTPVTGAVAADAAQREGASIAITAAIQPVGHGTQIVVELIDPRTAEPQTSFVARAMTDDEILPAVAGLARQLRDHVLGVRAETLRAMPRVTTASLAALRSYIMARDALAHGDRQAAIQYGEAALVHDSSFAMAHYLLGDVLWYEDHQRHSTMHLASALAWSAQLPPRERLIIRARYEQLVRDRLDSALYYWQLLARSYPDEPLAYEGLWWTYRALGDPRLTASAAESALRRDSTPTSYARAVESRLGLLLLSGDTAALWRFASAQRSSFPALSTARYLWAFLHDYDLPAMLAASGTDRSRRQTVLVAMGRLDDARRELDSVRRQDRLQYLPRALLAQARGELTAGSAVVARNLVREALTWIEHADLSAPAYARLSERVADIAARAGDDALLAELRQLLARVDSGRALPSLRLASTAVDAFASFARGNMRDAASKAAHARDGMFFGMPTSILIALEADARAALGEHAAADSLYALVLARPGPPDGDSEAKLLTMAAVHAEIDRRPPRRELPRVGGEAR